MKKLFALLLTTTLIGCGILTKTNDCDKEKECCKKEKVETKMPLRIDDNVKPIVEEK